MSTRINLSVNLQRDVMPISKAASSLAALIKRSTSTGQPVVVTQKEYPTGVLLPINMFSVFKDLVDDSCAVLTVDSDDMDMAAWTQVELPPETIDVVGDVSANVSAKPKKLSEKVTYPAIPPPQPSPDGGGSPAPPHAQKLKVKTGLVLDILGG